MKIVLFAHTKFGYKCVRHLHEKQQCQLLVVSAPQDEGKEINGWPSVVAYCREHQVPLILNPLKKIGKEVAENVISFSPNVIFSCYYPLIIPESILNSADFGGLNFHGGILPAYRGCLSGVWAILNGETESGVTLHFMDVGIDTGDIVEVRKVDILPSDTAFSLYEKVQNKAFDLFTEVVIKLPNLPRYTQDTSIGKYYGRALPNKGQIKWNLSTDFICRFVRAMYFPPFPPALGIVDGRMIYVEECIPIETGQGSVPCGTVLKEEPSQLVISTGDGAIATSKYSWI